MPAEHAPPVVHDVSQPDPQHSQVKLCFVCRCPLTAEPASAPFSLHGHDTNDATIVEPSPVCASCRTRLPPPPREGLFAEVERELLRRAASLQPAGDEVQPQVYEPTQLATPPSPPAIEPCQSQQDISMDAHVASPRALSPAAVVEPPTGTLSASGSSLVPSPRLPHSSLPSPVLSRPTLAPIDTTALPASSSQALSGRRAEVPPVSHSSGYRQRPHASPSSTPDPLLDITRLRVRSQGHHCLYPGATFQGTQKSGRNSYDVNVTIVVRSVVPFVVWCAEVLERSHPNRTSTSPHRTCVATSASAG